MKLTNEGLLDVFELTWTGGLRDMREIRSTVTDDRMVV